METRIQHLPRRSVLPSARDMRDLDTVDTCRMRLLTLRTRIESNWPAGGHFFNRGHGLASDDEATIADLLVALPTPLPLTPGADPDAIFYQGDTDLRAIAGRAVDAGLALLDGSSLEATYAGEISMLESHRPGALQPIVVSEPSVGLLVATIIGTLEAIAEKLAQSGSRPADAKPGEAQPDGSTEAPWPQPRRGRVVPRI